MHEKVALEHSSKSTKYELESSYGDPVHEHFSFLKTAKLPRECNEGFKDDWDKMPAGWQSQDVEPIFEALEQRL